jgi:hypothetical protein
VEAEAAEDSAGVEGSGEAHSVAAEQAEAGKLVELLA